MKTERYKLLFSLLRSALWGEPFKGSVSAETFAQVLALAKEQTVYGLAFDTLSQLNGMFDKMQIFEAVGETERIRHHNVLVDRELKEIVGLFDKHGVDYLIVKGQTCGRLYPKPELRMSGDIDFLIHQEYHDVKDVIEKQLSVKLPEVMVEKEIEFEHGDVPLELHTSLREYAKKKHQEAWNSLIEKEWQEKHFLEIDDFKVRTLSPTMNASYVFIHLFFHFIREGVSLRQLCDWAMVLHHYKDEIDRFVFLKIMSDLDLKDACCAFGTILTDCMGLPEQEFPLSLGEKDRRWKDKILKDIFIGGNFGKLHHQAHSSWRYKLESMRLALKNTVRYFKLCPSEIGGLMPRLVKGNLKLLFS